MNKSRVLFLCTGNSCRSQMAEGIVNARLGDRWEAFSAGSRPAGYVQPLALQALAEIEIQHQGRSKSIKEFSGQSFDVVISLCEDADEECPVWLGEGRQVHRPFPDPGRAEGSQEEAMQAYRAVRDAIVAEIIPLLANLR